MILKALAGPRLQMWFRWAYDRRFRQGVANQTVRDWLGTKGLTQDEVDAILPWGVK